MPAGDAGRIRDYLCKQVEAARQDGITRLSIRAGDVHDALGLVNVHPNVCQVLKGSIFHRRAGVEYLVNRTEGPSSEQGANVIYHYYVLP